MAVNYLKYKIFDIANIQSVIKFHVPFDKRNNRMQPKKGLGQERDDLKLRQRPTSIGIVCMDLAQSLDAIFGAGHSWHSYLPTSYVKHLEASGALVIPIW